MFRVLLTYDEICLRRCLVRSAERGRGGGAAGTGNAAGDLHRVRAASFPVAAARIGLGVHERLGRNEAGLLLGLLSLNGDGVFELIELL